MKNIPKEPQQRSFIYSPPNIPGVYYNSRSYLDALRSLRKIENIFYIIQMFEKIRKYRKYMHLNFKKKR